eukprot:NODE_55_length_29507_cov_0.809712.p19 type:complete len:179 gc:universal NODE_55_length_29507_cov_0.809712:28629-28093(-)
MKQFLILILSVIQAQVVATTNGKAVFTKPAPTYVGDTGEIKIPASVPLGYNYTITWTYDNQFTSKGSSNLILDLLDPSLLQTEPLSIANINGSATTFTWFVDPKKYKGDMNGYILRLYDSTCLPGKCVQPGNGKLVISVSQPFIIYVPPAAVTGDNPLLSGGSSVISMTFIFLLSIVN